MSTPSKAALDLAVKPAGYDSWELFARARFEGTSVHNLALAYAADLDKADKQNREVLALLEQLKMITQCSADLKAQAISILRANLLPEPIDPDLLEAESFRKRWVRAAGNMEALFLEAIKRGRELAKEQDRG